MSSSLPDELQAPMYLQLFHGRKTVEEDMDDWGDQGPIFPIRGFVHITYLWDIKLDTKGDGDTDGELHVKSGDLIYYDGVYYGDWSIFPAEKLDSHYDSRVQEFNPAKAKRKEEQ